MINNLSSFGTFSLTQKSDNIIIVAVTAAQMNLVNGLFLTIVTVRSLFSDILEHRVDCYECNCCVCQDCCVEK